MLPTPPSRSPEILTRHQSDVVTSSAGVRIVRRHVATMAVLDQLDEDAAGAPWVDERDEVTATAGARRLVDELDPLCAQMFERALEGPDREAQMVQPRSALLDESVDGGVLTRGLDQLQMDTVDDEHRLLYPVTLDVLAGHRVDPEGTCVEVECGIEVLDGDPDLVDASDVHVIPCGPGAPVRVVGLHGSADALGPRGLLRWRHGRPPVSPPASEERADGLR